MGRLLVDKDCDLGAVDRNMPFRGEDRRRRFVDIQEFRNVLLLFLYQGNHTMLQKTRKINLIPRPNDQKKWEYQKKNCGKCIYSYKMHKFKLIRLNANKHKLYVVLPFLPLPSFLPFFFKLVFISTCTEWFLLYAFHYNPIPLLKHLCSNYSCLFVYRKEGREGGRKEGKKWGRE